MRLFLRLKRPHGGAWWWRRRRMVLLLWGCDSLCSESFNFLQFSLLSSLLSRPSIHCSHSFTLIHKSERKKERWIDRHTPSNCQPYSYPFNSKPRNPTHASPSLSVGPFCFSTHPFFFLNHVLIDFPSSISRLCLVIIKDSTQRHRKRMGLHQNTFYFYCEHYP